MKQLIALALFATALIGTPALAQKSNKFGHINSAELLSLMPERKTAAAKMDSITKDVEKQLQEMMTEYRTKQEKYTNEAPKLSELVKKDKEEELTSLGTRIQNFQQQAQQSLEQQEQALIEPIVSKAKKAIETVAKENGYTYIFDTSAGSLLFWEESDNILVMVKKKLNLP
ncbi:MAG TPA: OmpH family outer membrane protein [Flavobacteriales bacterium]|jgi:outer membrane protein|nr:OmpH family outer membrane protein [Flavobacteriales bacterium]HPH82082.1 OmpH family outer membrane protein [Flavobacteriales bacterium]